jgi:hypothetical protein
MCHVGSITYGSFLGCRGKMSSCSHQAVGKQRSNMRTLESLRMGGCVGETAMKRWCLGLETVWWGRNRCAARQFYDISPNVSQYLRPVTHHSGLWLSIWFSQTFPLTRLCVHIFSLTAVSSHGLCILHCRCFVPLPLGGGSCGHRGRVQTSPDICKNMQDKVSAACQSGAVSHPRWYAGHARAMSHTFCTTTVALASDGHEAAAYRWGWIFQARREGGRYTGAYVILAATVWSQGCVEARRHVAGIGPGVERNTYRLPRLRPTRTRIWN